MVLTYDSSGILQAMQNKWAVDRANDPYAKIGEAAGAGIASGYGTAQKSAIEEVANQKKSTMDFVNKILETNVPAMVIDQTKPINDPNRYRLIPVEQQTQIRESLIKQTPLPSGIALVPTRIFSADKPTTETTPMQAQVINETTGEVKPGYTYQGKVGDAPAQVKWKPVDEADKEAKRTLAQDKVNAAQLKDFMKNINERRDNAQKSLEIAEKSIKDGISTNDKEVIRQQAYLKNIDEANKIALSGDVESAKAKLMDFNVVQVTPESVDTGGSFLVKNKTIPATYVAKPARYTPPASQPAKIGADIKKTTATTPPFQGTVTNQKATSPNGDVFIWDGTKWIQQ